MIERKPAMTKEEYNQLKEEIEERIFSVFPFSEVNTYEEYYGLIVDVRWFYKGQHLALRYTMLPECFANRSIIDYSCQSIIKQMTDDIYERNINRIYKR